MPVTTPVILERETVVPPTPVRPKAPKPDKPEPDPVEETEKTSPVTVIVSNQSPLLMQVAASMITRSPDPVTIIELEKTVAANSSSQLDPFDTNQLAVALGERSTEWLKGRTSDFIEVLTSAAQPSGRHIPALPDPAWQFDIWSQHFPDARRIGAVISEAYVPQVQALAIEAEKTGLHFIYRVAANDQAAQVEFRRLTPEVDGLFLLPDPAIFNPGLITDVIEHSHRNGLRLLAYNGFMQSLGVDLVFTAEPEDVADAVLELINHPDREAGRIKRFTVTTPVSRQSVSRQSVSRQVVRADE